MSDHEDRARDVREGEELDTDSLAAYLREHLDEGFESLAVKQFPGGHSNLTYLVKLDPSTGPRREYVLRRPPFGSQVKSAHDMTREHRVLSALSSARDWAPTPALLCTDHDVMGCDFYLMERMRGVVLRRKVPDDVTLDEAACRRLCETLLDTLVDLHTLDPDRIGLGDLGRPEGYVERQVTGWTKRYDKAVTDDIPQMPAVAKWLAEHMPPSGPGVIIHNDYKFDNVIYDSTRFEKIVGVLDWEMATRGDALMDLGTSLSYWVQADDHEGLKNLSFGPTMLPGMYTRKQLAERYAEKTGTDVDQMLFYFVFGLFKTAVVLQQIYYRYKQGLTKDPRFGGLIFGVRLLAENAERALDRGSI